MKELARERRERVEGTAAPEASLERFEAAVSRARATLAELRAERQALRDETARLREEGAHLRAENRTLRERLAEMGRAAGNTEEGRRARQLERRQRELRGKLLDLLRMADRLAGED